MANKNIFLVRKSVPTLEGAGVHLHRAFPFEEKHILDPFLLLDDFSSAKAEDYMAGFPWHPHRGMETVTYMHLGKVEHQDSLGNKGVIGPGSIQWMNAGSGIIHQEMPLKSDRLAGFQLWVNLPRKYKMKDPSYQGIDAKAIPEIEVGRAKIKLIAGLIGKHKGPVKDLAVDVEYLDVAMPAHASFSHPVKKGYTSFCYVISGEALFGEKPYDKETLVIWDKAGDTISIKTESKSCRFLLLTGKPLGEPIAWAGPIVMNTEGELQTAFQEYEEGTFIKVKKIKK